jgi:hypothetical protein
MLLTQHAVERFQQRWAPDESFAVLSERLQSLIATATRVREKTHRGHEIWTADGVRFVVKRDPRVGPVVVTVLPDRSNVDDYATAFAEFTEWMEDRER